MQEILSAPPQIQDSHGYVYVFTREDLSPAQIAVQSCHASIEAAAAFKLSQLPEHPSVIILGIKNESKLDNIQATLAENGIRHVTFREPDLDCQITSIATEPMFGDQRQFFRKFQLIRPKLIGGAK